MNTVNRPSSTTAAKVARPQIITSARAGVGSGTIVTRNDRCSVCSDVRVVVGGGTACRSLHRVVRVPAHESCPGSKTLASLRFRGVGTSAAGDGGGETFALDDSFPPS